MNDFFKRIFTDKIIFTSLFGTISFILLSILLIIFSYQKFPPFIPLFNQMPWGDERLGTKPQIFIPVSIAILFLGINLAFSKIIYQKMPLVGRLIFVTGFLLSFLVFLFIVRTIQIIV